MRPEHAPRFVYSLLASTLLSGILAGCSTLPHAQSASAPPKSAAPAEAEPRYKPFPPDTLGELIAAEMAGQRGLPVDALALYAKQARSTRDPGVISRATQIALFLGVVPTALEMSRLWTEVAPGNVEAHSSLAISQWRSGEYAEAIRELGLVLRQTPDADFEQLLLSGQPPSEAARDKLLTSLDKLMADFPDNPHAAYSRGFWRNMTGNHVGAIEDANRALQLNPDFLSATLLKARALSDNRQDEQATAVIHQALQKSPTNVLLRHNYAKLLIRTGHFTQAEGEYAQLTRQHPEQSEFWLAHALMALENSHIDAARASLEKLAELGDRADEAQFYLGKLHVMQKDRDAAIASYGEVEPGPRYLQARQEMAALLAENGQLPEARQKLGEARQRFPEARWQLTVIEAEMLIRQKLLNDARLLLDQAITQAPDEDTLRYSRAMLADKMNDLKLFESDIRSVIARQPQNPVALNALGYTLADKTDRIQEALGYITEALRLSPNDPAIIDSMGWIQYRLGNIDESLKLLRKAWGMMQDDEIGAHLGEVLWQQNHKDEARKIWKEALREKPGSEFIEQVQKKLGVK